MFSCKNSRYPSSTYSVQIWCAVVLEIPHLSATSRTVSRRSPLITSRTSFFTASDSLKDGLPSRSSSAKLSLPSANLLCHLNINERLTLLCFSDCFKNLCVSVGVFPMSTQNFITARCSTFSANVPFLVMPILSSALQIQISQPFRNFDFSNLAGVTSSVLSTS